MKILNSMKHIGKGIGDTITSPFKQVGSIVTTAHDDIKGITKGVYSITKDVSTGVSTSLQQITSPVGLISIAVVIGGIALISMMRK